VELDPELASVCPYLAPFDAALAYMDDWAAYWGRNAGILIVASGHPAALQRHLRKIFVVQDETGQEFFFRYYDPRVLRAYLPTCTGEEARQFFGPVNRIYVEDAAGTGLLEYVPSPLGVRCNEIDLDRLAQKRA
jgi:hypothetical protein